MNCPNCGEENDEDAKFCENCGSKLTDGPLASKPTTPPKKEGWSTTSKGLIIAIVILIVVLGVMVGVLLKSNSTPTIGANSTNNTVQPITASTGIPISQVPNLAQSISQSGVGFSTMNFGGVTLDKNQCLYITARGIVMLNKGETGNIPINQYGGPDNPYGTVTSATIAKGDYVSMAQRTTTWMDKNGAAPNYVGITNPGQPDLSTYVVLKMFSKVLTAYKSTGQLPASIQIP